MPITKKKVAKGLPKRTYNPIRKRKYELYLFRSTCGVCRVTFRTPAFRKAHEASGHKALVGQRSCKKN
jgi:hypothetical protein